MTLPSISRLTDALPRTTTPLVRRLAIASLVSQIAIVVTGGAVRLTASGLGCPEWPRCTPDSIVTTPEMGFHGVIEFGNRLLTFVLVVIAVAMIVAVLGMRRERRDLFRLSIGLFLGIPAQAVIGGITVWTGLNPWVVGLHFLVSMVLVALATVLVNRARLTADQYRGRKDPAAPALLRQLLVTATVLTSIAVVLGVVVTGSGPHAGDHGAARNGLDSDIVTRVHALPVYLLVATVALAVLLAHRSQVHEKLRRALVILAAVVLAQGAIGYTQHFLHLPVALVALHMLGASLLMAAAIHALYTGTTRKPLPGTTAGTRVPQAVS
ncbi:COX15/CtaA family protein [Arthrobacter burdickii]|uniref:COX15/CtaA family protein n=1 Tax=Arthrobacter burdickii TaxID=3035920 RepID=A0ABT8K2V1_9MICC|nr:COX15/CtaA family protein [Arthrobacter burdickii]MDN4611689.1 COX15/CtaA family protein [Arthrobacter burdickii]